MDDSSQRMAAQAYTAGLDQTLQELQQKVRQHEAELEKVYVTPNPNVDAIITGNSFVQNKISLSFQSQ
jgi:hypothetical protein